MLTVYVAGPYRAKTPSGVRYNVALAEFWAREIWRAGGSAFCPHTNSAFMEGLAPDQRFLLFGIRMLKHCDAILLVGDWAKSEGAVRELSAAERLGIRIYKAPHCGLPNNVDKPNLPRDLQRLIRLATEAPAEDSDYRQHCPRCGPLETTFLSPEQRAATFRCAREDPCGWRKQQNCDTLEYHDMLTVAVDTLQARVTALSGLVFAGSARMVWHHRITQPTKPSNVMTDAWNSILESSQGIKACIERLEEIGIEKLRPAGPVE